MTNNFETLAYSVEDSIGTLVINRPSKLNALNIQVLRELKTFLSDVSKENLKGMIVTGEGEKAFIAGADIAEMKSMSKEEAHAFSELGQQVTLLFEALPFPTLAAVNGFALGGGFEMALSCDFIFASSNAVFGLPEVKLGLIPGFGGTVRLARITGERRARELMFSGRNIPVDEAQKLGICLEVFPTKTELLQGAKNWFGLAAKNSSYAISRAKFSLRKSNEEMIQHSLKTEREEFGNIFQTEQMIEGTNAFLEKRKANFK